MIDLFQRVFWAEATQATQLIVPLIAITIVFKLLQMLLFKD